MSGMLPGVECARRRRLHHSGGGSSYSPSMPTRDSTSRSFCLYIRNLQTPFSSSSSVERSALNGACPEENLGGAAMEAKRRLDERFTAHMKSENKRYSRKRKSLFHALWHQFTS
ncbi:uncharacterized protein LOC113848153 [Abrus precatorius]|uniref:Uncharacterized protein LOC113848153 n=1 Tax=Abrus precatorius TaxID=3816 RepID=A0A8B8JPY9_ABRPR|nr:uncharacterized protein LOC113848153 [Abrus precatorius]